MIPSKATPPTTSIAMIALAESDSDVFERGASSAASGIPKLEALKLALSVADGTTEALVDADIFGPEFNERPLAGVAVAPRLGVTMTAALEEEADGSSTATMEVGEAFVVHDSDGSLTVSVASAVLLVVGDLPLEVVRVLLLDGRTVPAGRQLPPPNREHSIDTQSLLTSQPCSSRP